MTSQSLCSQPVMSIQLYSYTVFRIPSLVWPIFFLYVYSCNLYGKFPLLAVSVCQLYFIQVIQLTQVYGLYELSLKMGHFSRFLVTFQLKISIFQNIFRNIRTFSENIIYFRNILRFSEKISECSEKCLNILLVCVPQCLSDKNGKLNSTSRHTSETFTAIMGDI